MLSRVAVKRTGPALSAYFRRCCTFASKILIPFCLREARAVRHRKITFQVTKIAEVSPRESPAVAPGLAGFAGYPEPIQATRSLATDFNFALPLTVISMSRPSSNKSRISRSIEKPDSLPCLSAEILG